MLGLCTAPDHMDSFRAISKEVDINMSVFFYMHEFAQAAATVREGICDPRQEGVGGVVGSSRGIGRSPENGGS